MRFHTRLPLLGCLLLGCAQAISAGGLHCPRGDPVTADLGQGVVMRTCLWQNEARKTIRVGPLELIRNGILILKAQSNLDGQLHGRFTSWSDDGEIIKDGFYHLGQKHGSWLEPDADGEPIEREYHEGKLVQP